MRRDCAYVFWWACPEVLCLCLVRSQVASRPVDVWEYRTAHRRTVALLQTAMMTSPRLATLYAMLFEGNAVVLIFGRAGPSLLLLVSIMVAPHLSLAILAMQLSTRGGAVAWLLCLAHLSLFSASLLHLSTLPPSSWPRASLTAEAKLIPLTLIAASASFLAPWWFVDLLHTIAVSTPLLLFALVAYRKMVNNRRAARLAQSQSRGAQCEDCPSPRHPTSLYLLSLPWIAMVLVDTAARSSSPRVSQGRIGLVTWGSCRSVARRSKAQSYCTGKRRGGGCKQQGIVSCARSVGDAGNGMRHSWFSDATNKMSYKCMTQSQTR